MTNSTTDTILRAILNVSARRTFPPDQLGEIVMAGGAHLKQLEAFNMCDGTVSQGEVAKALKLDPSNFSRTVARWVDAGVMFRLGEGRETKLLHIYPLSTDVTVKKGGRKK